LWADVFQISQQRQALFVIGNLMERFQKIIEKGRVDLLTASSGGIINLCARILMIGFCLYALYALNFSTKPNPLNQPVDFLNVVFIILTILCIYLFFLSLQKLKIKFYKSISSFEKKKSAIETIAAANKWKLEKAEMNYYFFWENNYILSYYITIVFDEKGFYINSYPFLDKILDFGSSQKNSDDIYDQIKGCL
jgi:hypothetical protein